MSVGTPGDDGMRGDDKFPRARSAGLIVTESDDELVIYDKAAKHIHHLNEVSATIWRLCDGQRGASEIAVAATDHLGTEVGEDAVRLALRKLNDANLLAQAGFVTRESRRRFARKAAMFGAAAVPAVVSITAPLASASASSCTGDPVEQGLCSRAGDGRCCDRVTFPAGAGVCRQGECVLLNDPFR